MLVKCWVIESEGNEKVSKLFLCGQLTFADAYCIYKYLCVLYVYLELRLLRTLILRTIGSVTFHYIGNGLRHIEERKIQHNGVY